MENKLYYGDNLDILKRVSPCHFHLFCSSKFPLL